MNSKIIFTKQIDPNTGNDRVLFFVTAATVHAYCATYRTLLKIEYLQKSVAAT